MNLLRPCIPSLVKMNPPLHTKLVTVPPSSSPEAMVLLLKEPIQAILSGEAIAIPTETVYGLAANALDPGAVAKIFKAKGRPSDNPLIVHIADDAMLASLVSSIPPEYPSLMKAFWPGPITFLFPKAPCVPDMVTAGRDTVAIRMPSHPVARALIKATGVPLAAPSANLSGRPSPTHAEHVLEDLLDRIPFVIDSGPCSNGLESTVLNGLLKPPLILRPGHVTLEMLQAYLPDVQVISGNVLSNEEVPLSPGMKYTHYAPTAPFLLCTSFRILERTLSWMATHAPDLKIGLLISDHELDQLLQQGTHPVQVLFGGDDDLRVINSERRSSSMAARPGLLIYRLQDASLEGIAVSLFDGMRGLDRLGVDYILMNSVPETAQGLAIMNRAQKAASLILSEDVPLEEVLSARCLHPPGLHHKDA